MHSKHLQIPGSYSFHRPRVRETIPAGKLGSLRVDRTTLPCRSDARSSFQHPQNNLGDKKGGAGRVDQPSKKSLEASFRAQKLDESLSDHRLAPSSKLLPEPTPLCQFDSEEGTGQTSLAATNLPWRQALGGRRSQTIQEAPPPTQLWQFMLQLGEKIAKLQQAVSNLAELLDSQLRNHSLDAKLGDACAEHNDNNNNHNNNTNDDNNNITNNTNNHTTKQQQQQ